MISRRLSSIDSSRTLDRADSSLVSIDRSMINNNDGDCDDQLWHQIGVQPGQHRWVQIKLCQIGFPSLLVGLVCFQQEVRIDSPSTPQVHIIIGSSPLSPHCHCQCHPQCHPPGRQCPPSPPCPRPPTSTSRPASPPRSSSQKRISVDSRW